MAASSALQTLSIILQVVIILTCLIVGAKKGGIALGLIAGIGLLVLVFGFRLEPGEAILARAGEFDDAPASGERGVVGETEECGVHSAAEFGILVVADGDRVAVVQRQEDEEVDRGRRQHRRPATQRRCPCRGGLAAQ